MSDLRKVQVPVPSLGRSVCAYLVLTSKKGRDGSHLSVLVKKKDLLELVQEFQPTNLIAVKALRFPDRHYVIEKTYSAVHVTALDILEMTKLLDPGPLRSGFTQLAVVVLKGFLEPVVALHLWGNTIPAVFVEEGIWRRVAHAYDEVIGLMRDKIGDRECAAWMLHQRTLAFGHVMYVLDEVNAEKFQRNSTENLPSLRFPKIRINYLREKSNRRSKHRDSPDYWPQNPDGSLKFSFNKR
jgi:hypothetical protein